MADMYFLGNSTNSQMMGIVICWEKVNIVIDSGAPGDWMQLNDIVKEKAGNKIDAWFFTHPDFDHIGAFVELWKSTGEIDVKAVYCHFPAFEDVCGRVSDWEADIVREFQRISLKERYIFLKKVSTFPLGT